MRVLQINNYEEVRGGSDRVYQLTTKILIEKGCYVASVSCGTESFDSRKNSLLLDINKYISNNPITTLFNAKQFCIRSNIEERVVDLVKDFRPDIAHLHIFYGQISSSILKILKGLGVPCVMTVHEYRMLCPVSTMYNSRIGVCERCASGNTWHCIANRCNKDSFLASAISVVETSIRDRWFAYTKHIDHFLMVSEFCRNKHLSYLPEIRDKSSVLYNCLFESRVSVRARENFCDAPFLYVGRISYEKGLLLLCKAFAQRPKFRVNIIGDGPQLASLRSDFNRFNNINFLGKLSGRALEDEFKNARFAIVPSQWYENNPMSILESFGMGTPVIGAAIGGIPELVIDGKTGFLFQPSNFDDFIEVLDKAASVAADDLKNMGESAVSLINTRHTSDAYFDRLSSVYRSVIR